MSTVDVLFVAGTGRSGSTLLESLIAEQRDVFAVGELCYLWDRSVRDNQLCGCGRTFRECPFWSTVWSRVVGELGQLDADAVIDLARSVTRTRYIPALWSDRLSSRRFRLAHEEYTRLLGVVYRAITDSAGGRPILDSSKDGRYGFVLGTVPGVRMRVVHVVRDSRAVAYSWQRVRLRPEIHWTEETMPTYSASKAARMWSIGNAQADMLRARAPRAQLLRYEDLVADPDLGRIRPLRDLTERSATGEHPAMHSISGNPMRFSDGGTRRVQLDDEWRTELTAADFRRVTALTGPQLLRYGYRLGR